MGVRSPVEELPLLGGEVTLRLADDSLLGGLTDLRWRLDELLPARSTTLVVDISGLSQLSSATLAGLIWAQRRCRARGGAVVLQGANRRSRQMLARTGLSSVFAIRSEPAAQGV
jgi:anti-anti-sigma factor